jgi:predicted aspartyl protease
MRTTIAIRPTAAQPFILVPALVNQEGPFEFAVDTGAAMSIVTDELADSIGIRGTETKEGLGSAGRRIEVPLGRVESISVGEVAVSDLRVGIMKELPRCVGRGVLGYNFLKGFTVTVDYGRSQLTLASPEDEPRPRVSAYPHVPLRLARPDRPILLVDVVVDSEHTFPFILDTGASHTVVSPDLARRAGVRDVQGESIIGVGGATRSSTGVVKSLSVGEALVSDSTVIVADIFSALSEATGASFEGILGFDFLSRFRLEIDYPNETLGLATADREAAHHSLGEAIP